MNRWILFGLLAMLIAMFFVFDLHRYLDLAYVAARREQFAAWYAARPLLSGVGFVLVYVAVTGLSLPGAAVLTLLGGALFGVLVGTVLVSIASVAGATLAFLSSRYLLRQWVERRYGKLLAPINRGLERDGPFYLFTLRMVPVFPFFVVNLLMGVTRIGVVVFALTSQVGMLPATLAYVFAGTQLARLQSLGDVLNPGLLAAFLLLGVLPLATRKFIDLLRGESAAGDSAEESAADPADADMTEEKI